MNILGRIIVQKKKEISEAKAGMPLRKLERRVKAGWRTCRSFLAGMNGKGLRLIAEIKKGSPSKGVIRHDFDPVGIAQKYMASGVDAVSVLTDGKFFFGGLRHLRAVSRVSKVPVLRKDFLIDPYQLWESRFWGADMVLLIAGCLPGKRLEQMFKLAGELGMESLVEVHDNAELEQALDAGAKLIGVNNRNLGTFKTDLGVSLRLIKKIPEGIRAVSESGIVTGKDAATLRKAGFDAVLVGEALMREKDPSKKIRELKGHERSSSR